ncbi:LppA family lipoprotein [Nocardia halotolerans]|uniref:LppA family lipoprotein n=1 Tax=Nocardia halotolerans TaxID=1755878 RepID=A0ABV8VTQ8_9NOCA
MERTALMRVIGCLAAVAIVAGCGLSELESPYKEYSPAEIAHAEDMMSRLPSLADTEKRLATLIQNISEAMKTVAPDLEWEVAVKGSQGKLGCLGAYSDSQSVSMTTDMLTSSTPISDDEWPEVLQLVRDLAATHGITSLTIDADSPGNHDVTLHSPDHGNRIRMGTFKAVMLGGVTGCRFRADDLPPQPGE